VSHEKSHGRKRTKANGLSELIFLRNCVVGATGLEPVTR
jgi:hypothetical protein